MRHLITGGSGFIGNLIARRLAARGEQVRILDRSPDPTRPDNIEFIAASTLDAAGVAMAMRDVDIVHHAAALVAQTGAGRHFWDVNVTGTGIVAQEAVKAGVKAVVHLSTTAVFGMPPATAIDDRTPLNPIEPYGRSKLAGERVMQAICGDAGVPLITIRPRATLGMGRLGIFQILFEWIRDNRTVYLSGAGDQRLQFIHVHDLMDFYMLALDAGRPGVYNVGTDCFGTLREDLEALIAHVGSTSRVRGLPVWATVTALRTLYYLNLSPLVPWHYRTYHRACHFDVAPLLAMGWRPKYSNQEMLRESYDWYVPNAQTAGPDDVSPHRSPARQGVLKLIKALS